MFDNKLLDYFVYLAEFEKGGTFHRRFTSKYEGVSHQPWFLFKCVEDSRLSFTVHDLELGEKEAGYWHLASQRGKEISFEGRVSLLYHQGIGDIRGSLCIEGDEHKISVKAKSGRIIRAVTQKQVMELLGPFAIASYSLLNSQRN